MRADAIIGYTFLAPTFTEFNDDEGTMCPDVMVCWITLLTQGLQKSDIGEVMDMRPVGDQLYPGIVVYQFTFYVIVLTILMNVIFGIIIDTFGELRTGRASIKRQMEGCAPMPDPW